MTALLAFFGVNSLDSPQTTSGDLLGNLHDRSQCTYRKSWYGWECAAAGSAKETIGARAHDSEARPT